MGSTASSGGAGTGRAPSPEWDAVTDAVERCRAWWLVGGVARDLADDMAAELEAHLRERRADGGTVEDVVGDDLGRFAADWAKGVRADARPRHRAVRRVLARVSNLLVTSAVYALAVLLVDAVVAHGEGAIRTSDLVWFGLVVAAQEALARPAAARRLLVGRSRALTLLAAATVVGGPLLVPLVTRMVGQFGPAVFTLGWPQVTVLVLAAALATWASLVTPRRDGG